jgi:hypothetical protein
MACGGNFSKTAAGVKKHFLFREDSESARIDSVPVAARRQTAAD